MEQHKKIAILGGSGRTGHYLVHQLLNQGFSVKCLVRSPEKIQIQSPLLEVMKGDALDADAIHELVQGCEAVINTIGQRKGDPLVSAKATELLLHAMNTCRVSRYIALTGVSIDVPGDKKSLRTKFSSTLMRWIFPSIIADKQRAYHLLTKSAINWTLVRVPFIDFTDTRKEIRISLNDCAGKKISATDLSYFLIDQLWDHAYNQKVPFIANV